MKLIVTIDDEVLRRARMRALRAGTTVNALVREYLEAYAGPRDDRIAAIRALLRLAQTSYTGSGERRWTRGDLHS